MSALQLKNVAGNLQQDEILPDAYLKPWGVKISYYVLGIIVNPCGQKRWLAVSRIVMITVLLQLPDRRIFLASALTQKQMNP